MKCQTTELEIETIVNRIRNGDIDLQPDFQRGEIWTMHKKRTLIDSILRGWRIPPIHFVLNHQAIDEVLDGQQRLATIRDFYENKIRVDGTIEPYDEDIIFLNGLFYCELPVDWQRRFRQYSINIVRLTECKPDEPAELFYRLNQPSSLTSAEQRNAYIGITRDQVKHLSNLFISWGGSKDTLGFSNSRLAYDEVISKFCYCIEQGTLKKKITSEDISKKYRAEIPFSNNCMLIAEHSIHKFMNCITDIKNNKFSFNKATLFSWLVFTRDNLDLDNSIYKKIICCFEFCRAYAKGKLIFEDPYFYSTYNRLLDTLPFFELMLNMFNQRSSMGSTDALSIIYRDVIIAIFRDALLYDNSLLLNCAKEAFYKYENVIAMFEIIVDTYNWGEKF